MRASERERDRQPVWWRRSRGGGGRSHFRQAPARSAPGPQGSPKGCELGALIMQTFDSLDGALLIDKPAGPTSHDIVDNVRRHFGIKKVGHCGTLDPNATGLLILLLGRATKLSEKLMSADKVYAGAIKLGETTASYDADGELTASLPVPPLTLDELNATAESFIGDQMQ